MLENLSPWRSTGAFSRAAAIAGMAGGRVGAQRCSGSGTGIAGTRRLDLIRALRAKFTAGLPERRPATARRSGVDSLAVIAAYLNGLAVLYRVK